MNSTSNITCIMSRCVVAVGIIAADLLGVNTANAQEPDRPEIHRFELTIPQRSDSEVADRARSVASIMRGQSLGPDEFAKIYARDGLRFAEANGGALILRYDSAFDTLALTDLNVANDFVTDDDIGEEKARDIFVSIAEKLIASAVLDDTGIDLSKAELQLHKQGEGVQGQPPRERTKEYAFFVRRAVGGIGVRSGFREAGFQIAIHRRGDLASIRMFGPKIGALNGNAETVQLGRKEAGANVHADFPGHEVEPRGLSYVLDEETGKFVLGWDHRVGSNATIGGETFHGRLQYVTKPIDKNVAQLVWPKANPNITGGDKK